MHLHRVWFAYCFVSIGFAFSEAFQVSARLRGRSSVQVKGFLRPRIALGASVNGEGAQGFDRKLDESKKRWVVVVDDEESIRQALEKFLSAKGYHVSTCADGASALNVCRSKVLAKNTVGDPSVPDAIVSDIRMPGMDGLEFLRRVRRDENLVGIPVVLLTAKGLTQDRIAGYKAGADVYLPKPFDPEELVTVIDNSITRHEQLKGENVRVDDLQKDLDEIKFLLLQKGGGGVGNGFVAITNVFLTADERVVLELLCKGLMTKEIAAETHLSTRRVEQLLTSMFRKAEVSNRTELVRWALSTGNVNI